MKFNFRTDYNGLVYVTNEPEFAKFKMNIDEATTTFKIANTINKSAFELMPDKVMYISIPRDKVNDKHYHTVEVFAVSHNGELKVCTNGDILDIENNDVIFSTYGEARKYTDDHNKYNELVERRDALAKEFFKVKSEVEKLASEIGK